MQKLFPKQVNDQKNQKLLPDIYRLEMQYIHPWSQAAGETVKFSESCFVSFASSILGKG